MPVTIEFLVSFLAAISLVFILSSALMEQHGEIMESMKKRHEISRVKGVARDIESWLNNGRIISSEFGGGNLTFRIEERLIVSYGDKVIEAEGVFVNDLSEPV